jgi:1-acyl-sn-glycerol-3-phosphate acyltransferase
MEGMDEFYQPPRPARRPIIRPLFKILFKLFYFYRARGVDNLPREGPFLVASNHQSYFDPLLIGISSRTPLSYMAWAALFRGPRWFARLVRRFGAFPVDLAKPDPAAYRLGLEVLREGCPLVIFPEGEREPGGAPMALREGVARLALHAGVAIVPVRIEGAWAAWPKPRRLPFLFKPIRVTFGAPIAPPPRGLKPAERDAAAREIMEKLRNFLTP